jgi:hypothetical protein
MANCPECGSPGSHKPYCSQNPRYPTPPPSPTRKDKQHPVKRDDDGRKKKR